MRVMIYSSAHPFDERIIEEIKNKHLIQIDYFSDYSEAEYCAEIRKYDLAFIENDGGKKYMQLLANYNKGNPSSKIFIERNPNNEKLLSNYKFEYIEKLSEDILLTYIQKLIVKPKDIVIDIDNLTLYYKGEALKMKRKLDLYILYYFLRNSNQVISVSDLMYAVSPEPEYERESTFETSLASLRKLFRDVFGLNPFHNLKKTGYQFNPNFAIN